MRPKERRGSGQNDLLRSRLDQIVDPAHPLCKLARTPSLSSRAGYPDVLAMEATEPGD